jgi:hypothetical protein
MQAEMVENSRSTAELSGYLSGFQRAVHDGTMRSS